jgi:hypothetical protein
MWQHCPSLRPRSSASRRRRQIGSRTFNRPARVAAALIDLGKPVGVPGQSDTACWHTAIHEAGHAGFGRVLGMRCGSATIVPDHDSAGHAITVDPWATAHAWETAGKRRNMASIWRGRIMNFQAGVEAEAEIAGVVPAGDSDDRYQITLMAEEFECDAAEEARLRRHARRLVRRHRPTIERVATALIKHGQLSAKQIDALVWPRDAVADFISYAALRSRFNIVATRQKVMIATRSGFFPRAWMFNDRRLWRTRMVEAWVAARRAARPPAPPSERAGLAQQDRRVRPLT